MGNWGIENLGELLVGILMLLDLVKEFSDFNIIGIFFQGFIGSVVELGVFVVFEYGFNLVVDNLFVINCIIKEDIIVVYFEFDLDGEFNGMLYNLLIGV